MEEQAAYIWKSEKGSMVSAMIGRAMNTLLSCRPKKLEDAISRLNDSPSSSSNGSLEESLWFLNNYIRDTAGREEPLDEVIIPIIQHSLKCKESRRVNSAVILVNWLFRDEVLYKALSEDLVEFLRRKQDHYIALGWCVFVSSLVDCETTTELHLKDGLYVRHFGLVKTLCPSISNLLLILCNGSILQEGFELPTRLAVAAADCTLILTEALTKKPLSSENPKEIKSSRSDRSNKPVSVLLEERADLDTKPLFIEMEKLLWEHIDDLIVLVQKLHSWSRKSRPLHMNGSGKVLKWLQKIKRGNDGFQVEAGSNARNPSASLLSSCWKHYSKLLRLEDGGLLRHCGELIMQYLSGFQFYADKASKKYSINEESSTETKKFFLNCLALLLGRFHGKKLASLISEYGAQISSILIPQLHCADEDVIDGTVSLFRLVILETAQSNLGSQGEIEALLPSLLHLLDERDGAARAVVVLVAECCSIYKDTWCLQEVFKRLDSGSVPQRENAVDVISELVHIDSADSTKVVCDSMWKDIVNHLLERLGDEESAIRGQTIKLLTLIDPSVVLPGLVRLAYSPNDIISSSAMTALTDVLRRHSQKVEVISMLIDCLSNLVQNLNTTMASKDSLQGDCRIDIDRVLRLIPDWAKMVQDWQVLIEPILDKAFLDPSNATIIRFLSYISDHLADSSDLVLRSILLQARRQEEIDRSVFLKSPTEDRKEENRLDLQQMLFDRLSPLLVLRILPLRVFDDLKSAVLYGPYSPEDSSLGCDHINVDSRECVASFLLNRALCQYEFDDVRKLAAELCGRLHPLALIPVALSRLEQAAGSKDVLKIKACLFSVCTSLAVRGPNTLSHPAVSKIVKVLQSILSWPSLDGDEVSRAQHGCIDCLAFMICAEFDSSKPQENSTNVKLGVGGNIDSVTSVLALVIDHLVADKDEMDCSSNVLLTIPFRLCMANVLISACQKISDHAKRKFARKALSCLLKTIGGIMDLEIRVACVQVLFSMVYHLKAEIFPYASDLLKLSMELLRKGSEKERVAGAKLVASLLASEDVVVESILGGLLETKSILSSLSQSDPSTELRQMCKKLLLCLTTH